MNHSMALHEPMFASGIPVVDEDAALVNLMEQLCKRLEVPAEDRTAVIESRAFGLGSAAITLAYEPATAFVKVFIHLGRPIQADASRLYRHLLVQQVQQPAPFAVVAGVHPETDEVCLCGAAPMPVDDAALDDFVALLHACASTYDVLRQELPEGIVWDGNDRFGRPI